MKNDGAALLGGSEKGRKYSGNEVQEVAYRDEPGRDVSHNVGDRYGGISSSHP